MTVEGLAIEVSDVAKSFGNVRALRGVGFTVDRGKVEALLGENGAGKSTLIRILTGTMRPDSGKISIEGQEYDELTPRQAADLGIATVAQELSLFPDLSVAANVMIGREPRGHLGLINYRLLNRKSSELLSQLEANLDPEKPVRELDFAERQLVEIAKALATDPKVLILDEPTSGLREAEVEQLFEVVRRLQEQGRSIVFISHKLDEVLAIADQITVLKDGENVGRVPREEADPGTIIRMMVGREVESRFPPKLSQSELEQLHEEQPFLEAKDFTVIDSAVSEVGFSLWAGEICGLAGLQGQGQIALFEGMFGVRGAEGYLRLGQHEGPFAHPAAAIKAKLGFVPEDRKGEGLILDLVVGQNLSLASLGRFAQATIVDKRKENSEVRRQIDALNIEPARPGVAATNLSGGNQQKVALGKWLAISPQALLLADPTRGVDVGTKQEIYQLVRNLACEGLSIFYLSTDLTEIVELCDRVLVMFEGRIVTELKGAEITEEQIATASVGVTKS